MIFSIAIASLLFVPQTPQTFEINLSTIGRTENIVRRKKYEKRCLTQCLMYKLYADTRHGSMEASARYNHLSMAIRVSG
jgi:hypothetical protein